MATPQQAPLRPVTADERAAVERIARAGSERADRVRRATALLLVAGGGSFARAARQAGFRSGTAVADLVGRFNRHGLAALSIAAGRGRKPTYDTAARAQVVAIAQRAPDRQQEGTATWSLRTLQRALRGGDQPRIGTSTVRRVLVDAGSSCQQTRTWCPTGTAERKRKAGVVRVVDPETEVKRLRRQTCPGKGVRQGGEVGVRVAAEAALRAAGVLAGLELLPEGAPGGQIGRPEVGLGEGLAARRHRGDHAHRPAHDQPR